MQKKTYSTPMLQKHGKLEARTHGASTGSSLDAAFPSGTDFGDLTFS
ncbi:putative RiPP precursor [Thioclava sp. BHET1]|nr:putative RiPP precursor [Thioclava dalianensis]TMV92117.1 putative RiPP precursor [Thioclava sp. BHET1]SFM78969.1 hypothetical protein SAMN05216224_101312 [Thioclava dalianensis]